MFMLTTPQKLTNCRHFTKFRHSRGLVVKTIDSKLCFSSHNLLMASGKAFIHYCSNTSQGPTSQTCPRECTTLKDVVIKFKFHYLI